MDCLKDYVAPYYGYSTVKPLSGKYLTELAGINLESIEKSANQEQVDFNGVWLDVQATTIDTFREDVVAEFNKKYQLSKIIQTVDLGNMIDTSLLTPYTSGYLGGLIIELYQSGMQCIGSNLSAIYLQELNFYWYGVSSNPTLKIKFIDADTFNLEYEIDMNAVAGWNNIYIDKYFKAKRLFVLADGNFNNYVNQDISLFNLNNFFSAGWSFSTSSGLSYSAMGCGTNARIQSCWYNISQQTYTFGYNIYGLSAIISTACAWDAVVCKYKRLFASAWQHCLGIEFLNYRINTNRLNRYTTIDKKQAQELQMLLVQKYKGDPTDGINVKGNMYNSKLKSAIESIEINRNDGCIKGNALLISREALP